MSDPILILDREMVQALLKFSDRSLDPAMKEKMRGWSDPPRAIEVLEVVDKIIFGSLATGVILSTLQMGLDQLIEREGITHEELVKDAVWRISYPKEGE